MPLSNPSRTLGSSWQGPQFGGKESLWDVFFHFCARGSLSLLCVCMYIKGAHPPPEKKTKSMWMKDGVEVSILKFGDKILDVAVPNTM